MGWRLLIFALLIHTATVKPVFADSGLADGEAEFVRQLRSRGLYEIAESYCLRNLSESHHPNLQAEWELLLTDCQSDHAWLLSGSDRMQLIKVALSRITSRLADHPPSPELNLQLRIRQLELLNNVGLMETTVLDYGGSTPASAATVIVGSGVAVPQLQFAADACTQGLQLAERLNQQLTEIRRELDPAFVRALRVRTQFIQTEFRLSLARLRDAPPPDPIWTELQQQTEQLTRSGSAEDHFRAHHLSALLATDSATFDLRYRSLLSNCTNTEDRVRATLLKVRFLLNQQEPSEAIALLQREAAANSLYKRLPDARLLRLQAMLQSVELLLQIQSQSKERQQALLDASTEVRRLIAQLEPGLSGVWLQCFARCQQRFELMLRAGPAAATRLQQVRLLASGGRYQQAREALYVLLQQAGTDTALAAFAAHQAGDLGLHLQDWAAAEADLARAIKEFLQLNEAESAARSDVLRIFALGQLWQQAVDNQKQAEQRYHAAMLQHIANFPLQSGITTVRSYLVQYLRDDNPLDAARQLLPLCRRTAGDSPENEDGSDPNEQAQLQTQLADLLLRAAGTPQTENAVHFELVAEWMKMSKPLLAEQTESASPDLALLSLQNSSRLLWAGTDEQHTDWAQLEHEVDDIIASTLSILADLPQELPSDNPVLRAQLAANSLKLLCKLRQLTPPQQYAGLRAHLLSQPEPLRTWLVYLLANQLKPPRTAGHSELSEFLLLLLNPDSPSAADRQNSSVLRIRLATMAGDAALVGQELRRISETKLADSERQTLIHSLAAVADSTLNQDPELSGLFRSWWLQVLRGSPDGADDWLEASLQLARLATLDDNAKEATRILSVVGVLHPDWGSPSRRQRAERLLQQLHTVK